MIACGSDSSSSCDAIMLGQTSRRVRCGSNVEGSVLQRGSEQIAAIEGRDWLKVD